MSQNISYKPGDIAYRIFTDPNIWGILTAIINTGLIALVQTYSPPNLLTLLLVMVGLVNAFNTRAVSAALGKEVVEYKQQLDRAKQDTAKAKAENDTAQQQLAAKQKETAIARQAYQNAFSLLSADQIKKVQQLSYDGTQDAPNVSSDRAAEPLQEIHYPDKKIGK